MDEEWTSVEPIPPDAVLMRPMDRDDIAEVAALAREQGRNTTAEEYERLLGLEGARAWVLVRNDELIGAATAMCYFEHGFLGPLILRAGSDSAGLAIALLAQLIEAIQREGVHVIDAEAAPAEAAILERMGFTKLRETLVMERRASSVAPERETTPMEARHLLDVGELDATLVGFGRKQYLDALRRELPARARVIERAGGLSGYALVRRGARGYHVGPLVTREPDAQAATTLLRGALASVDGPVVALVPADGPAVALLEKEGFQSVSALTRMRAGARDAPGGKGEATEWLIGGRMTG